MDEYKVITGTAKEVEKELNRLNIKNWAVVIGVAATNEQTTIVAQIGSER